MSYSTFQYKENNEPVFFTIYIKSEFWMFQLQVNSNEKVRDIIQKCIYYKIYIII